MNDKNRKKVPVCLLLDSSSAMLARGAVESPPDAPNMQIRITEGLPSDVESVEIVQVVSILNDYPSRLGRVIHRRGDLVVLEPLRALSDEVRRNLRMPVCFESRVYPLYSGQKGGVPIRSHDLSCGGISFFADGDFEIGDYLEVIIPITKISPLILQCQILRIRPEPDSPSLYAAKFVDMINDQEIMVREAVFSIQLSRRSGPAGSPSSGVKRK